MCPQAPWGCEIILPKFPHSFHIGRTHSLGHKLLSLNVFRAMEKLFPTSESCLALPHHRRGGIHDRKYCWTRKQHAGNWQQCDTSVSESNCPGNGTHRIA